MKRLLERTTFMIIGALIAGVAYLAGNADRGAEAQDGITIFEQIACKKLIVKEDSGTGMIKLGFTSAGNPQILLSDGTTEELIVIALGESTGMAVQVHGGFVHMGRNDEGNPSLLFNANGDTGGYIKFGVNHEAAAIAMRTNAHEERAINLGVLDKMAIIGFWDKPKIVEMKQ